MLWPEITQVESTSTLPAPPSTIHQESLAQAAWVEAGTENLGVKQLPSCFSNNTPAPSEQLRHMFFLLYLKKKKKNYCNTRHLITHNPGFLEQAYSWFPQE